MTTNFDLNNTSTADVTNRFPFDLLDETLASMQSGTNDDAMIQNCYQQIIHWRQSTQSEFNGNALNAEAAYRDKILLLIATVSKQIFLKIWNIKDSINDMNAIHIADLLIIGYNLLWSIMKTNSEEYNTEGNEKVILFASCLITQCLETAMDTKQSQSEEFNQIHAKYLKFVKRTKKHTQSYTENEDYSRDAHQFVSQFLFINIKRNIKQMLSNSGAASDLESALNELHQFIVRNKYFTLSFRFGIELFNFAIEVYDDEGNSNTNGALLCYQSSYKLVQVSIANQTETNDVLLEAVAPITLKIAAILKGQGCYKESLSGLNHAIDEMKNIEPTQAQNVKQNGICKLLQFKVLTALQISNDELNHNERTKIVFEALGNHNISLQNGIQIIDTLKEKNYIEMAVEALNKLQCRFPSDIQILSRKFEIQNDIKNRIKILKQIEKASTEWTMDQCHQISVILWQVGAQYLSNGEYKSADSIWKHAINFAFSKLTDLQPNIKAQWLRARVITQFNLQKYDEASQMLQTINKMEPNHTINTLLEARICVKCRNDSKAKQLLSTLESDPNFNAQFYGILVNDVMNDNEAMASCIGIDILEKAFVNHVFADDVLILKCLCQHMKQYLNNDCDHNKPSIRDKLKKYLKLSLQIECRNPMDLEWFACNLWDLALQQGTAELFDAAHDVLQRVCLNGGGDNSKYVNTQKLCRIYSAVAQLQSIWNHTKSSKQTAKKVLSSMASIKGQGDDDTEFPVKEYVPLICLIELKCYLILQLDANINRFITTDIHGLPGMNLDHYESMISSMQRFEALEPAVVLMQHILNYLSARMKRENVCLDTLCDYVRYNRLLIGYKLKLDANDKQQQQDYLKYTKYFQSVAQAIAKFNENHDYVESSQQSQLDDEMQWFMSRSWNFGAHCCSNNQNNDHGQYISIIE
eukprot:875046_1